MTIRMNGLVAAGVASLVLCSGIGVSAAASRPAARPHSLSRVSHSKSASSSHSKHKKSYKTAHKHKTTKS